VVDRPQSNLTHPGERGKNNYEGWHLGGFGLQPKRNRSFGLQPKRNRSFGWKPKPRK
jgi:hypothetical protein